MVINSLFKQGRYPYPGIEVLASAAGTYYVDVAGLVSRPGIVNMGLYIQSDGVTVNPFITLEHADRITGPQATPATAAAAPWFALPAVPSGTLISTTPIIPTCLKLVFAGAGRCLVACV